MVPPANCYTVLVIDDLLPNRVLLGKVLKMAGYAVVEAADGAAALSLLSEGQVVPDLIVTDIEMPGLDGIAVIERLRKMEGAVAAVPVIAASGNADPAMELRAQTAGCDRFLAKPFDLAFLRREIATLLKGRRRVGARDETPRKDAAPNRVALRQRQPD